MGLPPFSYDRITAVTHTTSRVESKKCASVRVLCTHQYSLAPDGWKRSPTFYYRSIFYYLFFFCWISNLASCDSISARLNEYLKCWVLTQNRKERREEDLYLEMGRYEVKNEENRITCYLDFVLNIGSYRWTPRFHLFRINFIQVFKFLFNN